MVSIINIPSFHESLSMYVCMHACKYVRKYVSMYACMHVCMYACMYVYMYICTYVCMFVILFSTGTCACDEINDTLLIHMYVEKLVSTR